jgi:hypothetical protein
MHAKHSLTRPLTADALQVDVVDHLSISDFRHRYLLTDRPVIIKGGAADWSAVQKWSPDYLKERFGNHPVNARFLPHGVSSAIEGNSRPEKPRTMGQFVDTMRAQPADGLWYLVQQPIPDLPADLVSDFGRLPYNSRAMQVFTGHKPYFWMGSTGSMTGLHYDLIHNFNIQIAGRKSWRLYPRSQQHLLYFGHGDYPHHSIVNIFRKDLSDYPLLQQATPVEFVLDAGDILFFPAGWPHSVYCSEESISINFFSLWFRLDDLKIMFREAPPWIYKKLASRVHSVLAPKRQPDRAGMTFNSRRIRY